MRGLFAIALALTACTSSDDGMRDPEGRRTVRVQSNLYHSCAVSELGQLRCWGSGHWGLLAGGEQPECGVGFEDELPSTCAVGDDEPPSAAPLIDLGGAVRQVALGYEHACAVLESGSVRCWGHNLNAALFGVPGLGDIVLGDDEAPASLPPVDLGEPAVDLAAGIGHTCARTESGGVRCWGLELEYGTLGYGTSLDVGDDETPASVGDVPIGGPVRALDVRDYRTCAVLETGALRCWGTANPPLLGYGELALVTSTPEKAGDVPLGFEVVDVALSPHASCVLDTAGSVWCWGEERYLGAGTTGFETFTSDQAIEVFVGAEVEALEGGDSGICVVTGTGGVRCWGELHGYPGGANELPGAGEEVASLGDLDLGIKATSVTVNSWKGGCVTTESGAVRCWGRAPFHGYPGVDDLGDDEPPGAGGDLEVF